MSMHVNLILETEKRSGSNVSPRFILFTSLTVLAVLLVMGGASLLLGARAARQNRMFFEEEKKRIDPVYDSVVQTRGELNKMKTLVNLLEGWQTSRLELGDYLRAVQLSVPANLQLMRLTMQQDVEAVGELRWQGNIYLRGQVTAGLGADAAVRRFNDELKVRPPLDEIMADAKVVLFTAGSDEAAEDVRIFNIEGQFHPRNIILKR